MTMPDQVIAAARSWIGTPYRHQASLKGVGCDCLGLIRGIWREVIGPEPQIPPPYTADWSEWQGHDSLITAMARHFPPAPPDAQAGCVLVMRIGAGRAAKHLGILADAPSGPVLIHAYSGHGVTQSALGPAWHRRIAARFIFPERAL